MTELLQQPAPAEEQHANPRRNKPYAPYLDYIDENGYYKDVHGNFEHQEQYYSDDTYPDQPWDIKPYATTDSDFETVSLTVSNDLEVVGESVNFNEAIDAYQSRYNEEALESGEVSPQSGAAMLLSINTKFEDSMNFNEHYVVANEGIRMGHAIAELANKPLYAPGDQPSIQGLSGLGEILQLAEQYVPEEVPVIEHDMRDFAKVVDARIESGGPLNEPVSEPYLEALDEYDNLSREPGYKHSFGEVMMDHVVIDSITRADERTNKRYNTDPDFRARYDKALGATAAEAEYIKSMSEKEQNSGIQDLEPTGVAMLSDYESE